MTRYVNRRNLTITLTAAALSCLALAPAHSAPAPRSAPKAALGSCAAGELCLWDKAEFKGARRTYELSGTPIESCVVLPGKGGAQSFANRTGRPVTTYQSEECAETGEFDTYPGKGSYTPQAPYRVRAFKIWER
ncbi:MULTISPECIES: peptidase inhibitor family I36 protein [Streptomyces]|uniref:Proteinase inhibitor I36 SMPI n=2 Tax=Streptomyces TaxID=1883 RepID=A0A0B5F2P1_STRA4|nr:MULTISPECIES: peptidase inhibitor family I36 protein [Streptomyces]AJE85830.1 proteinase inhibitor I36 SMPI [Streptomyces albus]AOU80134.1 proteinase inhibitor I36 SMPI [Streptomyces albus]AYN35850.1 proteinase inhibitor I36 SMPI [Streptomyces albus]NKI43101.1 proteinase inhibitor I36 SMPI [Streptomyces physcomitrii]